jgi:hypothetical protein
MDKKRILIIGAGIAVMGGAGYLLYKWQQSRAASNAANADAANQTDAQLAQLMMQSPLSYASNSGTSANVSGPSVDTGNAALQALINSVIDPSTTNTSHPTHPVADPIMHNDSANPRLNIGIQNALADANNNAQSSNGAN